MLGSLEPESDALGDVSGGAGSGALSPLHPATAVTDMRTTAAQTAPRAAARFVVRPGGVATEPQGGGVTVQPHARGCTVELEVGGVVVDPQSGGAAGARCPGPPVPSSPVAVTDDGDRSDINEAGPASAALRRRRPAARRAPGDFIDSPGRQDERRTTVPAS